MINEEEICYTDDDEGLYNTTAELIHLKNGFVGYCVHSGNNS